MALKRLMKMLETHGAVCEIQIPQKMQSRIGGSHKAGWLPKKNLQGWMQPASAQVVIEYGQRQQQVTHVVYFGEDPELQEGDRIVIGSHTVSFVGVTDVAGVGQLWRAVGKEES